MAWRLTKVYAIFLKITQLSLVDFHADLDALLRHEDPRALLQSVSKRRLLAHLRGNLGSSMAYTHAIAATLAS